MPFAAITAFLDPSVPFGLDFAQFAEGAAAPSAPAGLAAVPEPGDAPLPAGEGASGDVLPFRRRPE